MQLHSLCPLCNSPHLNNLTGYEHAFLCRCDNCGFIFSKRIPSDPELKQHYNDYPRNTTISSITLKRYDELLSGFEKYRKLNKLLDVGCGDGHFLERAKLKGWQVYGTEYTTEACSICSAKGITMFHGKLSLHSFTTEFDVIASFEVIEHINNPDEEIKNTHTLLRKGGIFYFTTPNFNSASRLILKNKWGIIEYPEHLSYYTYKTIHAALTQRGFKKENLQTTGISLTRLANGLRSGNNTPSANYDVRIRSAMEEKQFLSIVKKISNQLLSLFRIGDTIKGCYMRSPT